MGVHLGRGPLADALRRARRAVVAGPAGAGKTTLVSTVTSGDVTIWVALRRPGSGIDELSAAVADAERRAGTTLADGGARVVVDDVHHLSEAAATRLGALLEDRRAILVGRVVPPVLAAGADVVIGDDDLRLTTDELAALATAAGTSIDPDRLAAASGGWIGGAVLLVARGDPIGRSGAVVAALEAGLDRLTAPQRDAVRALAGVPVLPDGIDAALGEPGALEAARTAGVPVARATDGRWALDDWVRDHLRVPLAPDQAHSLSAWLRAVGEVTEAVAVLLDAGLGPDAARLLAGLGPTALDSLDLVDLDALVARLPRAAVGAEPRVLLLIARACSDAVLIARRTALLDELAARADATGDAELAIDVRAERARDLARDGEVDDADALARAVLDEAGSDQLHARAVAYEVRGRAAAWWAETDAQLAVARGLLEQGLSVARRLGSVDLESAILGFLAYRVDFFAGRVATAADGLDEAARLIAARPRRRAMLLTFAGEVLHHAGRFEEAAAALDDADVTAAALADDRLLAYVAWERARGAGWQGRLDEVHDLVGVVERHAAEWFEHPSGMAFLADVADLLDRGGDVVAGARMLERARARMDEMGIEDPDVLLVAAAAEARHGDPEAALDLIARIEAAGGLAPVRRWRLDLLTALSRWRCDDGEAAAVGAATAFDAAARLGIPDAPAHQEPEAVAALAGLAAAAGSRAASRALEAGAAVRVAVLGRFAVTAGGLPVAVPAGHPATLVKVVAALGGRAHVEAVIDAIWPELPAANARKLLRNVLTRLRRGVDGTALVVRRDGGDVLAFADGVEVDAIAFGAGIDRARALALVDRRAAAAVARVAVAQYRGDLLPDDRYADWASGPREVLRTRLRAGLHLLADEAVATGRVDDAIRHLERVVEVDPLDPAAHEHLASVLDGAGRVGAAARARARATTVTAALG